MTYRYKITFAYDGTNFAGFQVQPKQRTVELALTNAVNKIAKKPTPPIAVYGSGRTDSGVHALGQVAHFDLPYQIPNESLRKALNSILPLDILVNEVEMVDESFHARFNAHFKTYRYRVSLGEFVDPFKRNYTGHCKYSLDIANMQEAAKSLVGEHDFTSFVASGSGTKSNVRTIYAVKVEADVINQEIIMEFTGNGFLYNQVRIMTAFLLEVGSGQRTVDAVEKVILAKNRDLARGTAPASGLYLVNVDYDS